MNVEDHKQFVDTNILVYAFDVAAGLKHETAKALIKSLWESRQGALSIQVLQEFYVTITQKVDYPLSKQESSKIIKDLAVWHIHAPTTADILTAIDIQSRFQLSFWDAMIIQSASSLACDTLWTEDLSHEQKIHQTVIRNPFL